MTMFSRRLFLACLCLTPMVAQAQEGKKVDVLASFSIIADFVRQVGGERVSVRSLVPLNGDAHEFEPKVDDVKALRGAQLVVINGLGFEPWADRMVRAANYTGERLVASRGVKALSVRGAVDPHAWQDPANVKIYVANIRDALSKVDPSGAAVYERRAASYAAQIDRLHAEIEASFGGIPREARRIITSHDAFSYFGDAYGIVFLSPQGTSTDSHPSAQDVANLIRQIRAQSVRAVFIENMSNPRVIQQIASEAGVKVGGTLYADALGGSVTNYLAMMRHNTKTMTAALK